MFFTDLAAPNGVLPIAHPEPLAAESISPDPPPWPKLVADQTSVNQLGADGGISPDPPPLPK